MESKNIIFKHTLKEYKKRYRHNKKLLKFTKKEVEDFDKNGNLKGQNFILKGSKWWLIGDTYYQIPKTLGRYWFRNINAGVQACICLLGAAMIATAVTVPTIYLTNNDKTPSERTICITIEGVTGSKPVQEGNNIAIVLTSSDSMKRISSIKEVFVGDVKLDSSDYEYSKLTGKLIIKKSGLDKAKSNAKITITPILKDKEILDVVDFYTCTWSEIARRCTLLEDEDISENEFVVSFTFNSTPATKLSDFIGKERSVQLKHQTGDLKQTVRIIDTLHGKNESKVGNKDLIVDETGNQITNKLAVFTFEFKNLISDSSGNFLSYQWNDSNSTGRFGKANFDYLNSTIRYALTKKGYDGGNKDKPRTTILVGEKGGTSWSNNENYNKPIIEMLPDDLKNAIKTVQKSVGIRTSNKFVETYYNDKLFMPSAIELGCSDECDVGCGSTYSYYINAINEKRNKNQINNKVYYASSSDIKYDTSSGQIYNNSVINFAGYNTTETRGGSYWLRSPDMIDPCYAFTCHGGGEIGKNPYVYSYAYGIAPLFCI